MIRDLRGSVTVIGALDAGAGKVACTLWLTKPGQPAHILGHGQVPSAGFKAGDIVAPLAAAAAIQAAVVEAERSAGATAVGLLVSANGGRIGLVAATAELPLDPAVVTPASLNRLTQAGRAYAERGNRTALHLEPSRYRLDGTSCLDVPVERFGRRLEARMQLVAADTLPLRRLLEAVEQGGIPVLGVVPAALCSAVAVTSRSERRDGIAVVDLGAGTTSIAIYAAGGLVGLHTLAVGGQQLTCDVAEAHQVTWLEAERIKTTYASLKAAHVDSAHDSGHRRGNGPDTLCQLVTVGPADDGHPARALLKSCLVARVDTLLQLVADRIDAHPFAHNGPGRVVLTGGGSLLEGLPAYAARVLGRPVRLGWPLSSCDGNGVLASPAAAVSAGLGCAAVDFSLGIRVAATGQRPRAASRRVG